MTTIRYYITCTSNNCIKQRSNKVTNFLSLCNVDIFPDQSDPDRLFDGGQRSHFTLPSHWYICVSLWNNCFVDHYCWVDNISTLEYHLFVAGYSIWITTNSGVVKIMMVWCCFWYLEKHHVFSYTALVCVCVFDHEKFKNTPAFIWPSHGYRWHWPNSSILIPRCSLVAINPKRDLVLLVGLYLAYGLFIYEVIYSLIPR